MQTSFLAALLAALLLIAFQLAPRASKRRNSIYTPAAVIAIRG